LNCAACRDGWPRLAAIVTGRGQARHDGSKQARSNELLGLNAWSQPWLGRSQANLAEAHSGQIALRLEQSLFNEGLYAMGVVDVRDIEELIWVFIHRGRNNESDFSPLGMDIPEQGTINRPDFVFGQRRDGD
jgi:hypothetical protein